MIADILDLFAEVAHVPSHTKERRIYQQALRRRDLRDVERERAKLVRHSDRFLRRRYNIEPLQRTCACAECRAEFTSEHGLNSHLRHWRWRGRSCARP